VQSVQEFSKYFVWNARSYLLPLTLAIPAAMVAISLVGYVYKNFSLIKRKLGEAKEFLISSFTKKKGESDSEFRKRVVKNIFIGAACTALFAGMVSACVVCPIMLLPSYLAIPSAISGICLLGDALVNGKSYYKNLQEKVQSAKEWANDAFYPRDGESTKEASLRIAKNIALTVLGVAIVGGTIAAAAYGMYSLVHYALSQTISTWNTYNLLPFQTPVVVFMEYAVVGVLHGVLAVKNWLQGNKAAAAFHFGNLIMSFAFPIYYLLNATPSAPMRLHHSIIGLSLSLLPFKTMKAIGTTIMLDSSLYFLSSLRGYDTNVWYGNKFTSYDFMNFFLEHMSSYLSALAVMCGAEYAIDRILPKKEKPEAIGSPNEKMKEVAPDASGKKKMAVLSRPAPTAARRTKTTAAIGNNDLYTKEQSAKSHRSERSVKSAYAAPRRQSTLSR